jgi:tRNA(Ile)-lysidine synthase
MSRTLPDRVVEHVRAEGLFPEPGVTLLAVSGGPDSVALLDLLHRCAPRLRLELVVAHVDHGISPGSAGVQAAVAQWAARYAVPFRSVALGLGPGASETGARAARYRALRHMQREVGALYLVTAHHADDQIETVLLRALKGSGVAGLSGIPATGPEGLTRPLLPFRRSELEAWLGSRYPDPATHPPVHCDPANENLRHDRSWLRQAVLPVLEERFGVRLRRALGELGKHALRDRRAWSAALYQLPGLNVITDGGSVSLSRSVLVSCPEPLAAALLAAAAREAGCTLGPGRAARLSALLRVATSGAVFPLGHGWLAEVAFDRVLIRRQRQEEAPGAVCWGDRPEGSVLWAGWEVRWARDTAGRSERVSLVTWVTLGAGELRGPRRGEYLKPLGGRGRRPVARLLMEARVPRGERSRHPVVSRGETVLWLPGVCRGDAALPRPGDPALRIEARRSVPAVGDLPHPG